MAGETRLSVLCGMVGKVRAFDWFRAKDAEERDGGYGGLVEVSPGTSCF